MAWPPGQHFEELSSHARRVLQDVHIVRRAIGLSRALIDFEASWGEYRIIVSEIHRANGEMRYAYYALDNENNLIQGFDNSRDAQVIRLRYGREWKAHREEEIPHRHDSHGNLTLTAFMSFSEFVHWIESSLSDGTSSLKYSK